MINERPYTTVKRLQRVVTMMKNWRLHKSPTDIFREYHSLHNDGTSCKTICRDVKSLYDMNILERREINVSKSQFAYRMKPDIKGLFNV